VAVSQIALPFVQWLATLSTSLDRRSAARLSKLWLGVVLARGRRTVTRWIRAAGLSEQFRCCYDTVAAAGKQADAIAARMANAAVKPLVAGEKRLLFALDDTPTPRYGPCVQGAGLHHNPAPGPAGGPFVYGHVWVVLALLAKHSVWSTIALPLLARLYVRQKDLPSIAPRHRPEFRTKLELAIELLTWARTWLNHWGQSLWIVADGAYAKAPFLKPALKLGFTVVSRLRKDAALFDVPPPPRKGQRGRPRQYGEHRISLLGRATHRHGWETGSFDLYGKATSKTYKTFLATWRSAGGVLRVVVVREAHGWIAFFCTDPAATVAEILEAVADRFSLETAFRDLKEIVGAGQQQTRFHFANVGSFHLCVWTFTLTEAWSWHRGEAALVDRRSSPWDVEPRRPSHADKRNALRRELLREELTAVLRHSPTAEELHAAAERLLQLAA
jgi:DDE superfamily endonuclease